MGTRGTYGFRKNGQDKLTYNHFDSYPDYLGNKVVEFCKNHSIAEMNDIFDKIIMVNQDDKPTYKQIDNCIKNKLVDFTVSGQSVGDWYCLLRNCQGELEYLAKTNSETYMIDNGDFIKDSLWCEYGYIINLDDNLLEFYIGFQHAPQAGNRYGMEPYGDREYYPCKLAATFPLNEITDVDSIVEAMNKASSDDDE